MYLRVTQFKAIQGGSSVNTLGFEPRNEATPCKTLFSTLPMGFY